MNIKEFKQKVVNLPKYEELQYEMGYYVIDAEDDFEMEYHFKDDSPKYVAQKLRDLNENTEFIVWVGDNEYLCVDKGHDGSYLKNLLEKYKGIDIEKERYIEAKELTIKMDSVFLFTHPMELYAHEDQNLIYSCLSACEEAGVDLVKCSHKYFIYDCEEWTVDSFNCSKELLQYIKSLNAEE